MYVYSYTEGFSQVIFLFYDIWLQDKTVAAACVWINMKPIIQKHHTKHQSFRMMYRSAYTL